MNTIELNSGTYNVLHLSNKNVRHKCRMRETNLPWSTCERCPCQPQDEHDPVM